MLPQHYATIMPTDIIQYYENNSDISLNHINRIYENDPAAETITVQQESDRKEAGRCVHGESGVR